MKLFFLLSVLLGVGACASHVYTSYADWDINDDEALDRNEFVNAYIQTDYFKKWSREKSSITYEELYTGIFRSLDVDRDNKLSMVEFNTQIKPFYFGMFNDSFDEWDVNSDASIQYDEFINNITKTNLASLWDTSGNKRISKRELGAGMFYLSDANNNRSVDPLEFNIWTSNR
jgi:Ca2+-binding EF-hand superfamily protein